jgi:chromate transporter
MSAAPLAQPDSLRELFTTFNGLALQGFGGVLAVAQRALCEERGWLTQAQFVELLAVSRVLPGPNVCNLAVLVGDRCFGWRGAAAALAGMIALPLVIVLALAAMYSQFSQVPAVAGALKGMGAVAAGLIAGTALKLAATLRDSVLGRRACLALGVVTFMLVAILRLPLAWMILGVGAIGVAWGWRAEHAAALASRQSGGSDTRRWCCTRPCRSPNGLRCSATSCCSRCSRSAARSPWYPTCIGCRSAR